MSRWIVTSDIKRHALCHLSRRIFPEFRINTSARELSANSPRSAMGKYSQEPADPSKSCKARGSALRVHYKVGCFIATCWQLGLMGQNSPVGHTFVGAPCENTHETAEAIKGLSLPRAKKYLNDVIDRKDAIPFRKVSAT
eukprot:1391692-Amorphochlora_amoeboformis.AAC.2